VFNIVTAARKLMTYMGAKPTLPSSWAFCPARRRGEDEQITGKSFPDQHHAEDMYGKVMSIPDATCPPMPAW
jgi:hypothetical protein